MDRTGDTVQYHWSRMVDYGKYDEEKEVGISTSLKIYLFNQ